MRSEIGARYWQGRDKQEKRELMLRLHRERPKEFVEWQRRPEHRKRMAEMGRARWADPAFRERMLSLKRRPEIRRRMWLGVRRHYREHPETRQKRAEVQRKRWRDPEFRRRVIPNIIAGIARSKRDRSIV